MPRRATPAAAGPLTSWQTLPAPEIGVEYWHLK